MDGLRPLAPNFINVGMMNCKPPKKLPDTLQKFMDESGEEGVVFVRSYFIALTKNCKCLGPFYKAVTSQNCIGKLFKKHT